MVQLRTPSSVFNFNRRHVVQGPFPASRKLPKQMHDGLLAYLFASRRGMVMPAER